MGHKNAHLWTNNVGKSGILYRKTDHLHWLWDTMKKQPQNAYQVLGYPRWGGGGVHGPGPRQQKECKQYRVFCLFVIVVCDP